jgi:hypothetical protein
MGRARASATTVDGFTTIFGASRGSKVAQAQRDGEELLRARSALAALRREVALVASTNSLFDEIVDNYRESTMSAEDLTAQLAHEAEQLPVAQQLAVMAGRGDPLGFPGLTSSAVAALAQYFADAAMKNVKDEQGRVLSTSTSRQTDCALAVIRECFADAPTREIAHYMRLAPLCEAMAQFLAGLGAEPIFVPSGGELVSSNMAGEDEACLQAISALSGLPTAVLTGPMHDWPQAFAKRCSKKGVVGKLELSRLTDLVMKELTGVEDERAAAL